MRLYESLTGHVKELSENAARLGGAAGEILLEECTAKVRLAPRPSMLAMYTLVLICTAGTSSALQLIHAIRRRWFPGACQRGVA